LLTRIFTPEPILSGIFKWNDRTALFVSRHYCEIAGARSEARCDGNMAERAAVSDSLKPLRSWGFGEANHLQLLIDSVVDYAIYLLDLDGRVVSWNSGAVHLKGYTADEIIGQSFSRFYTLEDRQAGIPEKALRIARETGRFDAEGWRVRKDGTRFWATVVIDAVRDEQGKLIGFAKVTRDITERQLAHQALLESESRYRRLVQAVIDYAIFQLDVSGHIASWNAGAHRIKGYDQSEIIGETPEHILCRRGSTSRRSPTRAGNGRQDWKIRSRRMARLQGRLKVLGVGRH
jgi:PAS domain S-box-containing protein